MTHNDFRFDITSDQNLEDILKIAFSRQSKAEVWRVDGKRLIIGWYNENTYHRDSPWNAFMSPMKSEELVPMVISWLKSQDYGREPDTDGSNRKGFHVYNEAWGHIGGDPYAFIAIEPEWITYGK